MNISAIKNYRWIIKSQIELERMRKAGKYTNDRLASELVRMTHSIEKGLSIESPRLGFGHAKQKEMMNIIPTLEQEENPYYKEVCAMAIDALYSYTDYHDKQGYTDSFISEIKGFMLSHDYVHESSGGYYPLTEMI